MLLTWLFIGLATAQCTDELDPNAPFRLGPPEPHDRIHLHLELWADELISPWNDAILDQLDSASVTANFVLPATDEPFSQPELERLEQITASGHALALRRTGRTLEGSETNQIRQKQRQLKSIGYRARTIVTPLTSRTVEPTLGAIGFVSIIQTNAANHALPRYALVRPGRPTLGIVFPKGRYTGSCGTDPAIVPLNPANLDRVTRALHASYRDPGVAVVRVVLKASSAQDTDAEVLARWLTGPFIDWSDRFSTSDQIRKQTLAFLRHGTEEDIDPSRRTGGRIIPTDILLRAAEEMRSEKQIKTSYTDNQLNVSETFIGFAKYLSDEAVGDGVQLQQIDGPVNAAQSTLVLSARLERDDIVKTARQLIAHLPEQVPAASRVGETLLTASEFLAAMAAAIRGDVPIEVSPIIPPDPNAAGLGWGEASID